MVQISVTDAFTRSIDESKQISSCGYSSVAIILTTVFAIILALVGLILGTFRYAEGMPLAGSCSAAISAACHQPTEDSHASLKAVQWGAITTHVRETMDGERVRHCSFTSFPVENPIVGDLYE